MTEAEIRKDERRKCAEELRSLAQSHRECAAKGGVSEKVAVVHRDRVETLEYYAKRLLDWGE